METLPKNFGRVSPVPVTIFNNTCNIYSATSGWNTYQSTTQLNKYQTHKYLLTKSNSSYIQPRTRINSNNTKCEVQSQMFTITKMRKLKNKERRLKELLSSPKTSIVLASHIICATLSPSFICSKRKCKL